MKKEVILQSTPVRSSQFSDVRISLFSTLKSFVLRSTVIMILSRFYTRLLEMRITPLQTFHLTHAQLAFFMMVFPVEMSVVVRSLLVLWFALTLLQCRRSGLK